MLPNLSRPIKVNTFKKCTNVTITKYLREISNMIYNLKDASHILTDEEEVLDVIHSLRNINPFFTEHLRTHIV